MSEPNNSLTMDEPLARNLLDRGRQGVIGKPLDRVDGPAKVTGQARYSYEEPIENVAYGTVLTAEIGRGRVVRIDAEAAPRRARRDRGDRRRPAASRRKRQSEAYCRESCRGSRITVSPSASSSRRVLRRRDRQPGLVRVDYAPEAGRYDMMEHFADVEHEPPTRFRPDQHLGNLDAALASSAVKLDRTYTTPHHLPAALEPHATIASWRDDAVEIRSSLQMLRWAHAVIAASLEIDTSAVRILAPFVGGGFGGKTGVGPEVILAAIAAREIGRPVKVALTRRQTAHVVHRRSDTHQRVRIGCDSDGKILAIGHESTVSQKADHNFIEPVAIGSYSLYAGAARRFTHSAVCVSTCRMRARCVRRERQSECWRWRARWTRWPKSSASIRSTSASATSRRATRCAMCPFPPGGLSNAMTRARAASAGSGAIWSRRGCARANG